MVAIRAAIACVAVICACALLAASARAQSDRPDATVEFSGGSVAAGIGWTWGSGTVMYKGEKYPITVDGLSVGSVGAASVMGSGGVFGLSKIEDIEGIYTAATVGIAIGGGASPVAMSNQKGVKIDGITTNQGLKVSFAAGGVTIKLKKK
ncbi:MAG: hypothetical protein ACHQ6T_05810 [Myxococcota bacterium]